MKIITARSVTREARTVFIAGRGRAKGKNKKTYTVQHEMERKKRKKIGKVLEKDCKRRLDPSGPPVGGKVGKCGVRATFIQREVNEG